VACKTEHQVPLGSYRTWVKYVERGTFPHTRRFFTVLRCNHCAEAPCVPICPTTALIKRTDGIVDFDKDRCIGCKSCMQACPYDALYIDPNTNTAAKCNFCAHRVEVGLEPAYVIVCPERAIVAGDLDDARSEIARLVGLLSTVLTGALIINTLLLVGELLSRPGTQEMAIAEALISRGRYAPTFWGVVVGAGTILPLGILLGTRTWTGAAPLAAGSAAAVTLLALVVHEVVFFKAGQAVPLS
jgi:Fe-S-cluster-containing dehydrogenase component